jgi:hypothetical protein
MGRTPTIRSISGNKQQQQLRGVITDVDLRTAAYRQAMALYDSCVRHALPPKSQKESALSSGQRRA